MKTESSLTNTNKKACIVTGASSGIGRAICDALFNREYIVFGIGRHFEFDSKWNQISLDLTDTDNMVSKVSELLRNFNVEILVNSAGVAYYGLHETVSIDALKEMCRTNIEVPMILSSMYLKNVKGNSGGYIFNISSVTAEGVNTYGAAYGATKAALSSFSRSIFEESRKHNVKVIDIAPDMTATNLYRNANFDVDEDLFSHLLPEDVSNAVLDVLDMREGSVITKLRIQPQLHRIKKKG